MRVVLKVVGGKNDGREIAINIPKFIIGRGEEAHLRPGSDLVSRQHCSITKEAGKVIIQDMGSRNGTFVNGKQITEPHEAKKGDSLRVGRLQFEVIVDHAKPAAKKPKVVGVVDAATRTVTSSKPASLEDSITDWLDDDGDDQEPATDVKKILNSAETVQMNFGETMVFEPQNEEEHDALSDSDSTELDTVQDLKKDDGKKKKKAKYGKLPNIPKFSHDDSTTAADDVLRKFFNRR